MRAVGVRLVGISLVLCLSSEGLALQKRFENLTEEEAADLWLEEIATYIITKAEREVYESLTTPEERVRFIDGFWSRRDPTPETPENEYQTEHYRRLAYVNRFLGSGRPGWRTDQGRLYILLGPPDEIVSDPMGRQSHEYPTEVWIYRRPIHPQLPPNMEIAFVDRYLTGEYELSFNLLRDADATRQLEALMHEPYHSLDMLQDMRARNLGRAGTMQFGDGGLPELERLNELALVSQIPERQLQPLATEVATRFSFGGGALEGERQMDYFLAGDGKVCVPVTFRVPYRDFTFLEKPDRYESRFDVFGRVVRSDGEVADEFSREEQVTFARSGLDIIAEDSLLYQLILYVPPGEYDLELAIRDNASNTIRTAKQPLRVPGLSGESLSLSSVVLANQIVKTDETETTALTSEAKQPFMFGEFEVVPNFARVFSPRGALNVYFEAYNLALDDEGENSLKLSYRFERDGVPIKKVPATYLYPTNRRERSIMSAIPLKDFVPGQYSLVISLTDEVSGETVVSEERFEIQ